MKRIIIAFSSFLICFNLFIFNVDINKPNRNYTNENLISDIYIKNEYDNATIVYIDVLNSVKVNSISYSLSNEQWNSEVYIADEYRLVLSGDEANSYSIIIDNPYTYLLDYVGNSFNLTVYINGSETGYTSTSMLFFPNKSVTNDMEMNMNGNDLVIKTENSLTFGLINIENNYDIEFNILEYVYCSGDLVDDISIYCDEYIDKDENKYVISDFSIDLNYYYEVKIYNDGGTYYSYVFESIDTIELKNKDSRFSLLEMILVIGIPSVLAASVVSSAFYIRWKKCKHDYR